MAKLLQIVLCCVALSGLAGTAFSQTAVDSGKCPWKLPFTIMIHGVGSTYHYWHNEPTHHIPGFKYDSTWYTNDTARAAYSMDTNNMSYSLQNDLLQTSIRLKYQWSTRYEKISFFSLRVAFAHGSDSIKSFDYFSSDTELRFDSDYSCGRLYLESSSESSCTFHAELFQFDDSSIFATDSSYSKHKMECLESQSEYGNSEPCFGSPMFGAFTDSHFTATSVDLSGIFRPTHFSDQTSAVAMAPKPIILSITESNGALHASFENAVESRMMEVYSLLGNRVATVPIASGESEATISGLIAGLYFVRLGSSIAKVALP